MTRQHISYTPPTPATSTNMPSFLHKAKSLPIFNKHASSPSPQEAQTRYVYSRGYPYTFSSDGAPIPNTPLSLSPAEARFLQRLDQLIEDIQTAIDESKG